MDHASQKEELARLADFFSAPLFDEKYAQKEVHAINSEHQKNVQNPTFRVFETMNSLADQASPLGRFHTGDLGTLYTAPMANGTSPVDALRVYFKGHYCPAHMRLVTVSSSPLAEQLAQAAASFGNISRGSDECQRPVHSFVEPAPWPAERMGKWLTMEGSQPQAQMWLQFPLPDLTADWSSQPLDYIEHMLDYGGRPEPSRQRR